MRIYMKEKLQRKWTQRFIALALVTAISCTCVLGDKYWNREKTKNQVTETTETDVAARDFGQLRSADELVLAETDTTAGKISEALQEGYENLEKAYESGNDTDGAVSNFSELVSELKTQTIKELDQTDNGTEAYQEYRTAVLADYEELAGYVSRLSDKKAEKILQKIKNKIVPEKPYISLGDDLPFDNVAGDDITIEEYTATENNGYESGDTNDSERDLEVTNDTVINDRVRAEFQDCESPLAIYQYVKNNYMPEFYYGSRKGAIGTCEQKAGNDYDIASLLVGVLRDRGIPARYVRGEIEITAEQAMEWTATEDIRVALRQIAALGIPATGLTSEGEVIAVRLEHVWVEAYVPYTDYRGAGNQSGESLWIPLDPSFKKVSYIEGVDLSSLSDYLSNEENYLTADTEINGVNVGELSAVLDGKNSAMVKYMLENGYGDATFAEAFGGREIISEDIGYLPLSLPYIVNATIDTFDDIPEKLTDSITVSLEGNSAYGLDGDGEDSIHKILNTPDIYGKRIVLSYTPASETDQKVLDQYGSIFQTPAYLLQLKPQLIIDGEVVAEGSACNAGYMQKYTIKIHSAAPDKDEESIGNSIVAGGMYCIALDYGTVSTENLRDSADQIEALEEMASETDIYTDRIMGKMLFGISNTYFAQLDIYNGIVAGQNNVTATRDLSVGIVGFNANVVYTFDRPVELNEGGIFLDIGHDVHSVVSNDNNRDHEKAYMLQSGIYASAMEHGVLEQVIGVESVSTIKVLAYAQEHDIPIHSITKENLTKEIESLTVPEQVKEEITSSVNTGKTVIIPEQEITINQWSGVGYMVLDPDTFACAYMISGGLAGGAMTASEFLIALAISVVDGLEVMLGCMLLVEIFPVLAPLFIIAACISAICVGFSIGWHIGTFINTGDVRELQEGMLKLATFGLLVGIGEKLGDLFKNLKEIRKVAEDVIKAGEKLSGEVCFIAGTLVLTSLGLVPIETVTAGDMVHSFDPETQEVSMKQVEETFVRESLELVQVSVGGETITATPEHPFYVAQKGFVKAVKLRAGDILCTVNGEYVIVEQVQHEILESPVQVYNFRVAENHTYYVGCVSVGVHNAKCAGTGESGENNSGKGENVGTGGKYSEEEIQNILDNIKGEGFKDNPLRQAYESEVRALKSYGEELLESGMSEEQVARTLNQARRDLGVKYKDMTPQPLRDYIYEINMGRYDGDKLGPTYDYLKRIKKTDLEIIESSSKPNSNIDKLLSGFEKWLREQ